MPKGTFARLKEEKKQLIRRAFLKEFSSNSYDDTSISLVVKKIGIAKGSIYQYFEDKQDLFEHLINEGSRIKDGYLLEVFREDYSDFWQYFRALYEKRVQFDLDYPVESNFLYNLNNHLKSVIGKINANAYFADQRKWMEGLIQTEVDNSLFRTDVQVRSMAFLLFTVNRSIGDYLQTFYTINEEETVKKGDPMYSKHKGGLLLKALDEYFLPLKGAFDKVKTTKRYNE